MTKAELNDIFLKFLKRSPNKQDYDFHLSKNVDQFEKEISKCEEFQNLKKQKNYDPNVKLANPDIKIAILLSGHIRKQSLLKTLNKIPFKNYDIFVHTWDNYGRKGLETNLQDFVDRKNIELSVKEIPNLKKYQIENNKEFVSKLPKLDCKVVNYSSPEPFLQSQLYSIYKSYELMEEYKEETNVKYDIVVKLRFDAEIVSFGLTQKTVENINANDLIFTSNEGVHSHPDSDSGAGCMVCNRMYYDFNLIAQHPFDHTNIICDFYAYGSEKSMKKYCSMYKEFLPLLKKFEKINEKNVKKYKNSLKETENVYSFNGVSDRAHIMSLYLFKCSYPESILRELLYDYMLVRSTEVLINFVR